ncbi:hypothetical protein MSG28_015431 [Choristoneura fumiferana]|uniref:Uncharacterized protein n=1 Tax=Choristoneura fumiferana TaxID=7141 RepID=A0ACC0KA57_CHOFU|nr:hypothetical protein MSG28_015431 [Choristoneura fumiferana]
MGWQHWQLSLAKCGRLPMLCEEKSVSIGLSTHSSHISGGNAALGKVASVFIHVSTAYSNSHLFNVEERFYPCEASCDELERAVDKLTDEQINKMLPTILGSWPNTYTFTKALAEKELRASAGNLPLGIFRPAIVTSTAKEPLVCWLDNMYGPTGVAVGTVTGILRTLQCDGAVTADIVPVDMVVNCLMVSAANVHKAYKQSVPPSEPPIYNYVSSVENRITWGEFMHHNLSAIENNPFSNAVWYVSLTLHRSAFMNQLYIIFLHLLPGALVDGLAVCLGRKPKMLKVYRKIHKFSSVLSYFCTREIKFCNRNVRELWDRTSEQDKQLFPFSMAEVSWEAYFKEYLVGIRRYLFKDSDDTLPQARIKWKSTIRAADALPALPEKVHSLFEGSHIVVSRKTLVRQTVP